MATSEHPQAQFLWAIHRDIFHYAAYLLESIADNARDLDFALRWGFGWQAGPFETWQAAGWEQVANWIKEDIAAGQTMATAKLPAWVDNVGAVHTSAGSYAPHDAAYRPRSELRVYRRQLFPEQVLGEANPEQGETLFESAAVRLWTIDGEVGILSFRSKMHVVGADVLEGVLQAFDVAEQRCRALVVWHPEPPFSAGANLRQVADALERGDFEGLDGMVASFQAATTRMRDARIPTVAAACGLALGGGCEFLLHSDRVVAAFETRIGLVEAGVGLLPAAGACKEFALRASEQGASDSPISFLKRAFWPIVSARVASNALEAKQLGFLRSSDIVLMNEHELLYVALEQAKALAAAAYRAPMKRPIPVVGREGYDVLMAELNGQLAAGRISDHDFKIGAYVAQVLSGGDRQAGDCVDEGVLLDMERTFFVDLLREEKTQQRILHMLKTNKPLRN
ncbi:enoyl-CoA hydratase/isomerase family protein [Alkalilimnicola ehrlichii]|uniref:enoyl-CoA hydratase/isomerase family protein n=1 Tax=Alkalilimnicola ehrlichii TaxID=351052 RepID=UPI002162C924|nr:enoyl-CoA hydratase/isomerase family protein [Alkalilimnicola ehrlichii]